MKPTYEIKWAWFGKKTQKMAIIVELLAIKCHWIQRAAVKQRTWSKCTVVIRGALLILVKWRKKPRSCHKMRVIRQDAQSLHGEIPQKQREIILKGFRNGNSGVFFATNVAAHSLWHPRGWLFKVPPPKDMESYILLFWVSRWSWEDQGLHLLLSEQGRILVTPRGAKPGIKFKQIGVPSAAEIIKSSREDVIRFLDSVPPTVIGHFKQSAKKLIEEKGA